MTRILCLFGFHSYRLVAHVNARVDHIGCPRCQRQWAINYEVRCLIPWAEVRGFHAENDGYPESRP